MGEMRRRRTKAKLTLVELARKTGIDYSTLQALENGRGKGWKIELKKIITKALDVPEEEFFVLWPEELKRLPGAVQKIIKQADARCGETQR